MRRARIRSAAERHRRRARVTKEAAHVEVRGSTPSAHTCNKKRIKPQYRGPKLAPSEAPSARTPSLRKCST
jgi:hypothetical protein